MKYIPCKKIGTVDGENKYYCEMFGDTMDESTCLNSYCENRENYSKFLKATDDITKLVAMENEIAKLKTQIDATDKAHAKIYINLAENEARLHEIINEKRTIIKYLERKIKELIIKNDKVEGSESEGC